MLRSPLRPLLRPLMQGLVGPGPYTLVQKAIAILRKYGTNAHVYLPGVGTLSGITAGNYLDSAGVTAASVDNPVGLVVDSFGSVNATQATTANKPILRRGLLNQLLWSSDLTNAAYSLDMSGAALPVVTANAGIDPSGNLTADRLVLNKTGGTFSRIAQSIVASVGKPYTMGVWMKTYAGGTANVGIRLDSTGINQLVTSAWTLSAISATATIGTTSAQILLFDSIIGNDETADILVGGMGLFQGTLTAQQIIDAGGIPVTTTAAASSTTGKYSWQFDGSNDSLSLSAPLFQMSDDHCVIAAAKCDSATGERNVISPGSGGTSQQICRIGFNISAGKVNAAWVSDGAAQVVVLDGPTYTLSQTLVVSGRAVGTQKVIRCNGVQSGTSSTAMGATTVTTGNIGCHNSSGFFQGSIYPIIAIKGTVSDAELLTLERFVGQLSGVSI